MKIKLRYRLFTGFAAVLLSGNAAMALPAVGVTGVVTAHYETVNNSPPASTAGSPGSVNPVAAAGPGAGNLGGITDEALAEARAVLPGTVGAYAQACCFSPSFPPPAVGSVGAIATASQVTHWEVRSGPTGPATADVDVLAFLDGFLQTADFAGVPAAGLLHSSISMTMGYDIGAGLVNVFSANATLDDVAGLSTNGTATWTASFSAVNIPDTVKTSTMNYSEFFGNAFTIPTNTIFAWVVELEADAYIDGPFELVAVSDFLNTGDFDLTTDDPNVTIHNVTPTSAIPLPGSGFAMAGGLALAGAVFARRRR